MQSNDVQRLSVVSNTLPDPPYPADTQSKGWWFNIDMPRIRQSDTWALCPREIRPWLLLLWCTAWDQRPCGSLPPEPLLIAARIEMPETLFVTHQSSMLRGWIRHADNRLYHHVITEQVLHVLKLREGSRERVANWRKSKNQAPSDYVTRYQHVRTRKLHTGSGSGSGSKVKSKDKDIPQADLLGDSHKRKKAIPRPTSLPDGFTTSPAVAAWAARKGCAARLELRLERFVSWALSRGATYVDWDRAFMRAIEEDWAKIGSDVPAPKLPPKLSL